MNSTRLMREALEAVDCKEKWGRRPVFPDCFLRGLREALDAGLSCEQITASLVIGTGLYEMRDNFEGKELVDRVERIMGIIKGSRRRGGD